jgi:hypothetical protein
VCLDGSAVEAEVHASDEYEGFAVCHCRTCETKTEIGLSEEQLMRLRMAPPERPVLRYM